MTNVTDDHTLHELQATYADFAAGRYGQVIERAEALGQEGGDVAGALAQAAKGLSLEADGRLDDAARCMERALAMDVALPELLSALARYFSRSGRDLLAHYAFLMRDLHTPGAMQGLVEGLPDDETARYAPWAVRTSMTAPEPDLYSLAHMKATLAERHGPSGAAMVLASVHASGHRRRAKSLPLRSLIEYARDRGHD